MVFHSSSSSRLIHTYIYTMGSCNPSPVTGCLGLQLFPYYLSTLETSPVHKYLHMVWDTGEKHDAVPLHPQGLTAVPSHPLCIQVAASTWHSCGFLISGLGVIITNKRTLGSTCGLLSWKKGPQEKGLWPNGPGKYIRPSFSSWHFIICICIFQRSCSQQTTLFVCPNQVHQEHYIYVSPQLASLGAMENTGEILGHFSPKFITSDVRLLRKGTLMCFQQDT